jgi:hypothetical protein
MTLENLTQKEDVASSRIYPCCGKTPINVITYPVAGQIKKNSVCKDCILLDCFSKFIIEKIPIKNYNLKIKSKNSKSRKRN